MNESRPIWMSHVPYEWVTLQMNESRDIWTSHVDVWTWWWHNWHVTIKLNFLWKLSLIRCQRPIFYFLLQCPLPFPHIPPHLIALLLLRVFLFECLLTLHRGFLTTAAHHGPHTPYIQSKTLWLLHPFPMDRSHTHTHTHTHTPHTPYIQSKRRAHAQTLTLETHNRTHIHQTTGYVCAKYWHGNPMFECKE